VIAFLSLLSIKEPVISAAMASAIIKRASIIALLTAEESYAIIQHILMGIA